MKQWIWAVLIGGLVPLTPLFMPVLYAEDQPADPMWMEHHDIAAKKLKDALGLADDQVTQLQAALRARRDAIKPLRDDLRKDLKTLRDQIRDKAGDRDVQATLDQLTRDRKALQDAVQAANDKFTADTPFLTPTQRGKIVLWTIKHAFRGKGLRHRHEGEGQ